MEILKKLKYMVSCMLLYGINLVFAQNISSASAIIFPKTAGDTHIVPAGGRTIVMSAESIRLLPGTEFKKGSTALLRINGVPQGERLPLVFADPGVDKRDYSPLLNDDFDDLVEMPADRLSDPYRDVTLYFEKPSVIKKVSVFDEIGSLTYPAYIYAINGTEKTLIGIFKGDSDFSFIDFNISPAITATALVIHKYGNDIPVKIQAFGSPIPDGVNSSPLSVNLVIKRDLVCESRQDGIVKVIAEGGIGVYKPIFGGENATRGDKTYQYSIDGINFQNSGEFNNLTAASHTIYVKDAFSFKTQMVVQLADPPPFKAEFLASSVVNAGDTVIMVDITKASHTVENWTLPDNATNVLNNDGNTIKQVVFNTPGTYNVRMLVRHGDACMTPVSKPITVLAKEAKKEVNTALGYKPELISSIKLYPNPSGGEFTVAIELSQNENVRVRLHGFSDNRLIEMREDSGKSSYEIAFNRSDINPGIYFVTIEIGSIIKTLKLIKI